MMDASDQATTLPCNLDLQNEIYKTRKIDYGQIQANYYIRSWRSGKCIKIIIGKYDFNSFESFVITNTVTHTLQSE